MFPQKFVVWLEYVFSNCNTFLIECNKGLFLDVNLKLGFLKGKTAKVKKSKNLSLKKILSDLVSKLLILFKRKRKKNFVTNQLKLMF